VNVVPLTTSVSPVVIAVARSLDEVPRCRQQGRAGDRRGGAGVVVENGGAGDGGRRGRQQVVAVAPVNAAEVTLDLVL